VRIPAAPELESIRVRLGVVKTTVDIPDAEIKEAMLHTGAKTKRAAVIIAITELNRRRRLQQLAQKFGSLDDFMTRAELRAMREEA
jgi:Arc/MetJ family transcription regulator